MCKNIIDNMIQRVKRLKPITESVAFIVFDDVFETEGIYSELDFKITQGIADGMNSIGLSKKITELYTSIRIKSNSMGYIISKKEIDILLSDFCKKIGVEYNIEQSPFGANDDRIRLSVKLNSKND